MLYEQRSVNQEPGSYKRKFIGDYFDLIIWYDNKDGDISGFELSYDKKLDEHSILWENKQGYIHSKIDSGNDNSDGVEQSPVELSAGFFDHLGIARKFKDDSQEIDRNIARFVYGRLIHYPIQ